MQSSLHLALILLLAGEAAGLATLKNGVKSAEEQKLFDEAYRPGDSRKFVVDKSETFTAHADKTFDLSYADGTELKGFTGRDIVHVSFPAPLPACGISHMPPLLKRVSFSEGGRFANRDEGGSSMEGREGREGEGGGYEWARENMGTREHSSRTRATRLCSSAYRTGSDPVSPPPPPLCSTAP